MDRRLSELIRQYHAYGDSHDEMALYHMLLRSRQIPDHWLQLLAYFGDDVYFLPENLQPPTGFIESVYREEFEEGEESSWFEHRNIFPFVVNDDTTLLFPDDNPHNHQLVVNLVGIYLRQTLGWVFQNEQTHRGLRQIWLSMRKAYLANATRLLKKWRKNLKDETRNTVRQLLVWRPGLEVNEISSKLAHQIPDLDMEDLTIEETAEMTEGWVPEATELDFLQPALAWLLQLLCDDVAFPNKSCPNCGVMDYDVVARRKTCPDCRSRLQGPHTNISSLIELNGGDAFPCHHFIEACYAVWRHSGKPVEVLHQQILPLLRRQIINLVL